MADPAERLGYEQALRYAEELRELYREEHERRKELEKAQQELRTSMETLRRTDEQRRTLLADLVTAQEEERRRIAADLHDETMQVMTAIGMRLELLRQNLTGPNDIEEIEKLGSTVQQAIAGMRNLMFELRPPALDHDGFVAALSAYLAQTRTDEGPVYRLSGGIRREPPSEIRVALYRLAQEALVNIRKHARASRVDIVVEEHEGGVWVRIRDDGVGFRAEDVQRPRPGHVGMPAMRERAERTGGWLRLSSEPGAGTTVEFWVPAAPLGTPRSG